MSPNKETQKSAKSTTATSKKFKGFTDEERAAMKDHVQEMKASADRGRAAVRGRLHLLDMVLHRGSFLVRESLELLAGRGGALGGLLGLLVWAHRTPP